MTSDTITMIPLTHLRESPFNPRKSFDEAGLKELSISIAALGVMQPIVARPLPAAAQDIWVRHEIVFGHRRYRAARLAGLESVPVILRDMDARDAAIAQVHENIQRKDVTALEEADSFKRLHTDHGMTADAIALAVAKSRSYVYGRLKLATMSPAVRQAVAEEGLGAEVALEVARIADHALQVKALKQLRYPGNDQWPSYRDAKSRLRGMFECDTEDAVFDIADAALAPRAGPCTNCPKRAGNDPDLSGVLDAGVCTDAPCFKFKTGEHIRLEAVVLRAQGHRVIDGKAAEALLPNRWSRPDGTVNPKHVVLTRHGDDGNEINVKVSDAIEELAKDGITFALTYIVNPHDPKLDTYLSDETLGLVTTAWREKHGLGGEDDDGDCTQSAAARAQGSGQSAADAMEGWTPAERVTADRDAWHDVRKAVLLRMRKTPRTLDELRAILLREVGMAEDFGLAGKVFGLDETLQKARDAAEDEDQEFDEAAWYRTWIEGARADDLGALLAALAIDEALGMYLHPHRMGARDEAAKLVALAERYGVDVAAAARQEQMDGAGVAGGCSTAGAQVDAFAGAVA